MATDAITCEVAGAAEPPSLRKQDMPLTGSFVQDGVAGSNRYLDEFHNMNKDVTEIVASITLLYKSLTGRSFILTPGFGH